MEMTARPEHLPYVKTRSCGFHSATYLHREHTTLTASPAAPIAVSMGVDPAEIGVLFLEARSLRYDIQSPWVCTRFSEALTARRVWSAWPGRACLLCLA